MERLVIIDHDNHQLFIEDVSLEEIEKAGGEQEYIEQNYEVATRGTYWSWEFITDITYYPNDEDKDPIDVKLPNWKPSKEQLNSLSIAEECVYAMEDIKNLQSLYKDLSKLIEQ